MTDQQSPVEKADIWNQLRQIVIHTIGLGREHNASFLRDLARDHGGVFRDEQSDEMIDNAVRRSHWTRVERALANGVIEAGEAEGLEPPPL